MLLLRSGPSLLVGIALVMLGCTSHEDDATPSTGQETSGDSTEDTNTPGSSTGSDAAMEVDCSEAPAESLPVCLPRRDDGTCVDTPDEVELCQKTCIESCCFPVASIACGPDIAQTDRCCYWILVGEMTCAETPEETCLPD